MLISSPNEYGVLFGPTRMAVSNPIGHAAQTRLPRQHRDKSRYGGQQADSFVGPIDANGHGHGGLLLLLVEVLLI